tara:strand:- start:418 stop:7596 length:7179 start_codon:yes stop_codon:yes gene_type:complete
MFKTKEEFYQFGINRGYSEEEISIKEKEYYDRGYSFTDEPTVPFQPNKILNNKPRRMDLEGVSLDADFAEIDSKNAVRTYYGAKNNYPARQLSKGMRNDIIDLQIRDDYKIPETKPISYGKIHKELKQEHSNPLDDGYYSNKRSIYEILSNNTEPQKQPQQQPQTFNLAKKEQFAQSGYVEPEFALRDIFILSGEREFQEDALEGTLDVDYDESGVPIKGSGGVVGSTRYGTYNVGLSQRIMQNVLEGDRKQVQQLINNDKIIQEKVGQAYDYTDLNYFNPKRGGMMALQSLGMMAENAILGIAGSAVSPIGGFTAVTTYNQQLGAGDMMKEYLYDRDVETMPEDELKRAAEIAMTVGVPFALIEQTINIPFVKGTGFGTAVLKPVKRRIMKKLMNDPKAVQKIALGGVDAAYRILTEVLEEGGQEVAQEIGRQGMERLNPDSPYMKEIERIVTTADYKKVGKQGIDTMIQSLPAVTAIGGASASIQATFDRKYLDDFASDIEKAQKSDNPKNETFKVYRKSAVKKLTTMGLSENIADDLVDKAIYAETEQEVQGVIEQTQKELYKANPAFTNVGLRVLTNTDWDNRTEQEQSDIVRMFPEIKEDFISGINGDVDARNRYNAFVKNNQDAQYLDFLINQNIQQKTKTSPRALSEKQKEEILNSDIHDEKIERFRNEGESLDDAKLRFVYSAENQGDPFIRERIANVRKGLLRLIPNIQIIVAENDDQYLELTKLSRASAGAYQQGRIILNGQRVNKTTIAHEAFHALLDHYIGVDSFNANINKILDSVQVVANPELKRRMEMHRAKYSDLSSIEQKEEMIAELAGILSDSYQQLPNMRTGIKGFKDRVLGLAGIKTKNMADKEVINMFNSIVQGFSTGQTISEKDLKPISKPFKKARRSITSEQRTSVSKKLKTPSIETFGNVFDPEVSVTLGFEINLPNRREALAENIYEELVLQQADELDDLTVPYSYRELQLIARELPFFNAPKNILKEDLLDDIVNYMTPISENTFPNNSYAFDEVAFANYVKDNEDKIADYLNADVYDDYFNSLVGEADEILFQSETNFRKAYSSTMEQRSETPHELLDYLTDEEKQTVQKRFYKDIINYWEQLPDIAETAAVAEAGIAKKGWYEQSATTIQSLFGNDAPRFAALLAATSPKTSVEANLYNTVMIWTNWLEAGRPTDRNQIIEILGKSVQGEKGADSVLEAWINNSVRALTHDFANDGDLRISGAKVNSFQLNLLNKVNEVTLDTWMARFALVAQTSFGKRSQKKFNDKISEVQIQGFGYLAYASKIRATAEFLTEQTGETWTPAEVQETIWSWSKTLSEKAKSLALTEKEILSTNEITDDLISDTPDFATLFGEDETLASALTEAGYEKELKNIRESIGKPVKSRAKEKQFATGETGTTLEDDRRRYLERAAERLYESRQKESIDTKEQRDFDKNLLNEILIEIQQSSDSARAYLDQTISDYVTLRSKWDLGRLTPIMVSGFEEQTAEAVKLYGVVEDSEHMNYGEFNVEYFLQNINNLIFERLASQRLPSLNSTEQAAITLAVSILDKRSTELNSKIDRAEGEGRDGYASQLIAEKGQVLDKISNYTDLLIRARSEAGRLLGSHRNSLKEDYSLPNIIYRVGKITGVTELNEEDRIYFEERSKELNNINERKNSLDDDLEIEQEEYYDDQIDDYFEYTRENPEPESKLAKIRKSVKEIANRAGKFFGKFGGKEQRIDDVRARGGILDTDNYVDRPEVLCARLAELFINDDVRDGKPLNKESVLNRIKNVLDQDGHEFSLKDIKKAIAENTLPQYDLRKQYVAFLSMLKISSTLDEDLSKAASKIFDAEKQIRANSEDAVQFEAILDKLTNHFDALLNTINTIYDKKMVKELNKRIENVRQLSDEISSPKISKARKSKIVTQAQQELKLLRDKQRTKKRISELEDIIKNGNYDVMLLKKKKKESLKDKEFINLLGEERRLKNEINKKIAMLEQSQVSRTKRLLKESFLLPRTLKAMADMSAAFNQAIMYLGSNPVKWMKTFVRGFGIFFNAKYADKMDGLTREISRRYNLENYGLELTQFEGQLNEKEEIFLTAFFELPIIKQTIGKLIKDPSERHYVNFLNRMRVDMCVSLIEKNKKYNWDLSEAEIQSWAEFVNLASGRGKITDKFDKAIPLLSYAFFAPRLTASRFKLPYYSLDQMVKQKGITKGVPAEIAKTWAGFLTFYSSLAILALANGWEIEDDPEEADYLKLRKDKLVINPLGNFQQVARVHHLLLKEAKTGLSDEEMGFSLRPISRMFKWKLNPIFSFTSEVVFNKDWLTGAEQDDNEPIYGLDTRGIPVVSDSRFRAAVYNTTPITIESWANALDEDLSAGEIMSQTAPDFFGLQSSYYEKPSKKKKSSDLSKFIR